MARFDRTNFYFSNLIDNSLELDILNNFYNLSFQIKRPLSYYQIREQDLGRPDLLSYKLYGDTSLWWIIFKYNNIDDVWNDMEIGQIIAVPDRQDIEDFYISSRGLQN